MDFKNGVKEIETMGSKGVRTVNEPIPTSPGGRPQVRYFKYVTHIRR